MIDQSLLTSGFDAEVLLGERYLMYSLLTFIETGSLPLIVQTTLNGPNGSQIQAAMRLRVPLDYERTYQPCAEAPQPPGFDERAFAVRLLFDDPSDADLCITLIVDVDVNGIVLEQQELQLFATASLASDIDDSGNQSNAHIRIELLDVTGPLVSFLGGLGFSKNSVLSQLKPMVDRDMDLGFIGNRVQRIETAKLPATDGHPPAYALYVNLILRTGPDAASVVGIRGDVAAGTNFLPIGDDIAFGLSPTTIAMAGKDALYRMAEETSPGSGEYRYPLKDHGNVKGSISSISIRPQLFPPGVEDVLEIAVEGEYFLDDFPDPDFTLYIRIKPTFVDGVINWHSSYDVDLSPFLEVASFIAAAVVGVFTGPGGFIAGSLIAALLMGIQEGLVEPWATGKAKAGVEGNVDTTFLDAIPHTISLKTMRWDPFFLTKHQVVARTDAVQINEAGIGFSGKAALGRAVQIVDHVVIRTERRDDNGNVASLLYRVQDLDDQNNQLVAIHPGTDRLPFEYVTADHEQHLVELDVAAVLDRVSKVKLLGPIPYVAKKVYIEHNEVKQILCISQLEIDEISNRVVAEFRRMKHDELLAEGGDALTEESIAELRAETGTEPAEQAVAERVEQKLDAGVDEAEQAYRETDFPADLTAAIEPVIRFDLSPEELASLERATVLRLRDFEMIRMCRGSKVTYYYRDHPDSQRSDNLMSLPRYTLAGE